jgi:hypothetical protein
VFGICPQQAQKYPDYQKLRDFRRLDYWNPHGVLKKGKRV